MRNLHKIRKPRVPMQLISASLLLQTFRLPQLEIPNIFTTSCTYMYHNIVRTASELFSIDHMLSWKNSGMQM